MGIKHTPEEAIVTRLAVVGDIHGNLPALAAVMQDMRRFRVDQVVAVGDNVSWAPFSAQVMEIITREHWSVIRGNHEYYLLDYKTPRAPEHWHEYDLPGWLYEQLQGHWHQVIAGLPDELSLRFPDAPPVRVVHARPGNPWHGLYPTTPDVEVIAALSSVAEETVITAHTHLSLDRRVGRWHLLNPGSVGMPLDGDIRAQYLILEGDATGWRAEMRRVEYDLVPVVEAFRQHRLLERYLTTSLILKEHERARCYILPFNRWRKLNRADRPVSLALIEEYLALSPDGLYLPEYPVEYMMGL
ncbi:MAG: metallophosphoesterase family protein [Anaerolineae bacterium]|nr:metallophosphoesterase family protein [Anaerolineae bacterium]